MKYGFCEFYDKDNMPAMEAFFRTGNSKDVLGLRKMNIRISNMLFPECSTLMPNLVYFYYLNAIYHVLRDRDGKEPTEDEINTYEKELSILIEDQKEKEKRARGFFYDAQTRAYHWYKTSFKNLHFADKDWQAIRAALPQQKYLEEPPRYKFVKAYIEGNKEVPENVKEILDKTNGVEKMDFVRRLLAYDDNSEFRICESSYFANIVQDIIGITDITKNKTIYSETDFYKYMKVKRKELPMNLKDDPLPSFFGLNYGYGIYGTKINMYENLKMAQSYSYLQGVAKKVYNYMLFKGNREQQDKVRSNLKSWLQEMLEYETKFEIRFEKKLSWNWKKNSKYFKPFCYDKNETRLDTELYDIYLFIRDIRNIIPDVISDDFINRKWFKDLCEIVTEREQKIMGSDALLNSGFVTDKPYADYIDTFRWEYRPTDNEEEAEIEADIDQQGEQKESEVPHTMCAKHFIYELFYEK